MTEEITAKKMQERLKKEQEELLIEINNKIKKKTSSEPETGNQFLK